MAFHIPQPRARIGWLAAGLVAFGPALVPVFTPAFAMEPVKAAMAETDARQDSLLAHGIIVESDAGEPATLSLNADGSYDDASGATGAWSLETGVLCLVDADQRATCSVLPPALEPGSSWTVTDPNSGEATRFTIPKAKAADKSRSPE
jgi:hypothetical protein